MKFVKLSTICTSMGDVNFCADTVRESVGAAWSWIVSSVSLVSFSAMYPKHLRDSP